MEKAGAEASPCVQRGDRNWCMLAAAMTRPEQKLSERQTLDAVFAALGLRPDQEPEAGETPDFTVLVSGRTIGVEITTYQSGATVDGGTERRKVESEWDLLQRASETFRGAHPEFREINVGLMFSGSVPPRRQHAKFMEEIAAFIHDHAADLTSDDSTFWPPSFSTPLMRAYLRTLYLRVDQYAVWHSNLSGGFVARPDATIADIVAEKSAKSFRPADELWLVIQSSVRISEMMSDIMGVEDFGSVPSLEPYVFSRVFVLAFTGAYEWRRAVGWRKLTGETDQGHGPSFDELKAVLNDPEWLSDPDGKAVKVAMECLREIRANGDASLILPEGSFVVFVDDTGHEALVPGHPVYGLGGCAVMAKDLDRIIRQPWREVRRKVTGSPDTPLHANAFAGFATPENIQTVAESFHAQPFARLGGIISFKTALTDELGPVPTIARVLQVRIREIAARTAFTSLAVIFESSQRADRLIEEAFQGFGLEEGGKPLPVECYFMRKGSGDPALEVADFVMHAVGRQARQNLKKRGDFVPDFCAVFHSVERKLTSFMEVDSVTSNARIDPE
jgi:hypothetical protein